MGDAKYSCRFPVCLEKLVGDLFFKCLEYGTSMSYVVNLEGTQYPNIRGH